MFNEDSDLEVVSPTYSPPLIIKKNSIKSENKNNSIDPIENEEDNEQLIQIPTSSKLKKLIHICCIASNRLFDLNAQA